MSPSTVIPFPFRGHGTVSSVSEPLFADNGNCYRQITLFLSETHELINCYIWDNQYSGPEEIPVGSIIYVSGKELSNSKKVRSITCKSIRIQQYNNFELFFSNYEKIDRLIKNLDHPVLQQFVNDLTRDPSINNKWHDYPASRDHHHAHSHGLMQHSLEVAYWVLDETQSLGEKGKIATVAGLLHDIGKIVTYEKDGSLNKTWGIIHHEQLTMFVLSSHLKKLEQNSSHITRLLTSLLTFKQQPKHSRTNLLEETLLFADRRSAMRSIGSLPADSDRPKQVTHKTPLP